MMSGKLVTPALSLGLGVRGFRVREQSVALEGLLSFQRVLAVDA